jgi:hypothetical protein
MTNEFAPFTISKPEKVLYNKICKLVRTQFNKKVENIETICDDRHGKPKAYKLTIRKSTPIRLDIKHDAYLTDLQIILNKFDIEIPKVLGVFGKYKFSEWIDGLMLSHVADNPEVFIASGEMMARLNLIKIKDKFVTNSEFSLSNAVWTKDKKIYIIDHGKMKLVKKTDSTIARVLMKRIKNKKNIKLFLKGYSKYKDITKIKAMLTKYNYKWKNYVAR